FPLFPSMFCFRLPLSPSVSCSLISLSLPPLFLPLALVPVVILSLPHSPCRWYAVVVDKYNADPNKRDLAAIGTYNNSGPWGFMVWKQQNPNSYTSRSFPPVFFSLFLVHSLSLSLSPLHVGQNLSCHALLSLSLPPSYPTRSFPCPVCRSSASLCLVPSVSLPSLVGIFTAILTLRLARALCRLSSSSLYLLSPSLS